MLMTYAMLSGLALAVVVEGIALACLAVHALGQAKLLTTTRATLFLADGNAGKALSGLGRCERVTSEMGERIDAFATTFQSDVAEIRADTAESLRLAAGHIDGDYSFLGTADAAATLRDEYDDRNEACSVICG